LDFNKEILILEMHGTNIKTIIIVCSDNCNVPIFSSHASHQGCTNPRCLGIGCSVYVVRLLKETCTAASGWDDILLGCGMILIHVGQEVGVSKWCLHLVAHELHLSSANTVVLICALLIVNSLLILIAITPKTFFGALQAAFQTKCESGDVFHG
jgi:hypothetical protein